MKKIYSCLVAIFFMGLVFIPIDKVTAGNKDRSGQAGASELLINPWARGSGWGSVSTSCGQGLEALYTNIAGTGFTKGTELIFSYTNWLKGSGVNIMAFGISQKLGQHGGVITAAVMSMSFGDIDITTVSSPEPILGTFRPSYMNINLAYAKAFSNSIYGGLAVKLITESISDVRFQGEQPDNLAAASGPAKGRIRRRPGLPDRLASGYAERNCQTTTGTSGFVVELLWAGQQP